MSLATTPQATGFFGRYPLLWLGFALGLVAIPATAWIVEQHVTFVGLLPTLNATLNATSAILIFAGWRAIKARQLSMHWKLMLSATCTSALFLVFYVIRFLFTGAHRYPLHDFTRPIYFVVLSTHTLLAITVPFLVGRSLWMARTKRFDKHRFIARITFPIWMYVSVTGVVVYWMLYHLAKVG